jgi:hypothetical protein
MSEFLARAPGRQATREHATSRPDQKGARPLVFTQSDPAEGLLCLKQAKRGPTGNTAGATRKPVLPEGRPRPPLHVATRLVSTQWRFLFGGRAASGIVSGYRNREDQTGSFATEIGGRAAYFHTTRSH